MTNVRVFILEKYFGHAHLNLIIQKNWDQATMSLFFILSSVCHINNIGTEHFWGINDQLSLATLSYARTISSTANRSCKTSLQVIA